MANPNMLQRKRSSVNLEEKVVIKRQCSERTLIANKIESRLSLGKASPGVMEDQVPSLSPKFERAQQINGDSDDSFFLDITVFEKDSKSKRSKPDIERKCRPESEKDDYYLSEDVENKQVSFTQEVLDDVPIKTKTTEYELEGEGEDEPDGRGRFLGRKADKVDLLAPHHHHHNDEGFIIHLPARFHHFDTPCPFGARLSRSDEGYTLAKILSDTAAHKAGLREADVVTHLNGHDLQRMGIREIQKLFMHVDTVFTLTILRKCGEGDDVHFVKTTIKVEIADKIEVEVIHEEVIWSRMPRHVGTSALSYITQDGDDVQQIYLNTTGERVIMGSYTDERAQFYLDFYAVLDTPNGQRCVIRNATTNQIYDAVQNNMKTVNNYFVPDPACMLDKISRNIGFVFESVECRGHYLTYNRASNTLKLSQYPGLTSVPPDGSFSVNTVKTSSASRSFWV